MPDKLDSYRRKRDPARTPEPVPDAPPPADAAPANEGRGATFVVQEHHATALHWDLRLERDGVLVSWAVPKGLPLDPKTNHLAVHTEDHPMEYATFAGDIPAGEYGGGSVTVWDAGTYDLQTWTDREVKFVLHGRRSSGRYVLFATGGRNWMIHRMDPPPPGWRPLPDVVEPMLAVSGTLPPDDDRWAYEFKWDGVRAVVYVEGGRARVLSRNSRDVTVSYPEIRALAESMGSTAAVLDGEIVAFDADGRPSFGALQARMHVTKSAEVRRLTKDVPVTYLLFDVLHLDGRDLLANPYSERRNALDGLGLAGPSWQVSPSFSGGGAAVLAASGASGLEGVVAKRLDSPYFPGRRSECWVKVKNVRRQEVVIAGWKPGAGNREGLLGSLLIGVQTDEGLSFAGHVGTGFAYRTLVDLGRRLKPLQRETSPFATTVPREHARSAVWVEPVLVAEVEFTEWTRDGRMRHPSYKGLRDDKDPADVVREP